MSQSSPTRRLLKRLYHALHHPGVSIGAGSFVSRHARVHRSAIVGAGCKVFPSTLLSGVRLGPDCVVGHDCRLGRSTLDRNVGLEAGAEVNGSTLGAHVRLQPRASLTDTTLGRCSYVGRETYLNLVTAGSFVSLGPRCLLGYGEHPLDLLSTAPIFYSAARQCGLSFACAATVTERRPITIGHDVWIGAQVFVRDGVTIGDGAIIAAGAIVVADVPPFTVVGGVPARALRTRFSADTIAQLQALAWWNWPLARLEAAQPLIAQGDPQKLVDWAATHPLPP